MTRIYRLLIILFLCVGYQHKFAQAGSPSYSGSFQTVSNPFTKEQINFYRTGKYTDGFGTVWEGEFDFIPLNDSVKHWGSDRAFLGLGTVIFFGAKIDPNLDEVTRGLYIADRVRPESDFLFVKARPDYLDSLRSTFVADRTQIAEERAAEARASKELFTSIVTIASSAAVIYSANRIATRSDRATLDSLTSVVKGQKSAALANKELGQPSQNANRGTADTLTVAEYKAQQKIGTSSDRKLMTSNEAKRSSNPPLLQTADTDKKQNKLDSTSTSPTKRIENVIENNPYEQFASSPNSWGHPINGWLASNKWGENRESACSSAIDAQTKRMDEDESKGYMTVSQRTDCICGTYTRFGSTTFPQPQWTCGAYYKLQDTGKKRGTLSR